MPNRRQLLKSAAASPALLAAPTASAAPAAPATLAPNSIPVSDLPDHYDLTQEVHNLEAGYWSPMPRVVAQDFARHHAMVNHDNSLFGRGVLPAPNNLGFHAHAAQRRLPGRSAAPRKRSPSPAAARTRCRC